MLVIDWSSIGIDDMNPGKPELRRFHASRSWIFGLLTVSCFTLAVGYVGWARMRSLPTESVAPPAAAAASLPEQDFVMLRHGGPDADHGRVAVASLITPEDSRIFTSLKCDRIDFAADRGVCLTAKRGLITTYSAILFDADMQPRYTLPLAGIPSRTRLSPDGRYVAITVFVSGHSYADGRFSTLTSIYETASGRALGDLEQFEILRDGQAWRSPDFNFWGVTFARDNNRFYATLASGGKTYLIAGSIDTRQARVIRENVECPSLSPDNTRVAFKKRVPRLGWLLHVLDLETLVEIQLAEQRSIDDQVEWLDDKHVLYAAGQDVWEVPADGSGEPKVFLHSAYSPAVVRWEWPRKT